MEIVVDDDKKRVEIWLTRAEGDDMALRESLKPLFVQYKNMKYLVAVFNSGEQDLLANTRDLLLHNRNLLAKTTNNTPTA